MERLDPIKAVQTVPPGSWAIAVSGGADSVALLELLRHRDDLRLHVVHLDHELRGEASTGDTKFVAELAAKWGLESTISRYSEIEDDQIRSEANKSARLRAARLALFRKVIRSRALAGVIVAHHADDQAETIFQRLLRGSGPAGLGGMTEVTEIGDLKVLRPMLGVARDVLRRILIERGIAWREDASNAIEDQMRNRVRVVLRERSALREHLLQLGDACGTMTTWLRDHCAVLAESFDMSALNNQPEPMARESASRWLSERAGNGVDITPGAVGRLLEMAGDAASPARQQFRGGITVRRRAGIISVMTATSLKPRLTSCSESWTAPSPVQSSIAVPRVQTPAQSSKST